MIPKIIHCFWFGKAELHDVAKKCIASWKRFCPDYEIRLWNEKNYDITQNTYMCQSYEAKKYGFTVDYARLDVVYQYGGIYLDTDVELIKSLAPLLENSCFMGFETDKTVALGLGFGAEKGNPVIKVLLDSYNDAAFILPDGSLNLRPSPGIQTDIMLTLGMDATGQEQVLESGCHIYSKEVFNPCNLDTYEIITTDNTISIHHYAGSWLTKRNKLNKKLYAMIARKFGVKFARSLRKMKKKLLYK